MLMHFLFMRSSSSYLSSCSLLMQSDMAVCVQKVCDGGSAVGSGCCGACDPNAVAAVGDAVVYCTSEGE